MFSLHTCSMRTAVSLARVSTGSQVRNLKENCILENCIREKLYSGPCAPYGIPVLSRSCVVPLVISKVWRERGAGCKHKR